MPTEYKKNLNGTYTPIVTTINKDGGKSIIEKAPIDLATALVASQKNLVQIQEERVRLQQQMQQLDDEEAQEKEAIVKFKTLLAQEI